MTNPLRAIMVAVDYTDLLAITLPYNRHHFAEVMVVTKPGSKDAAVARDVEAATAPVRTHETDVFTRDGATFNKWAALEEALDVFGRHGWLCLMDADVLWPKEVKVFEAMGGVGIVGGDGNERILTWEREGKTLHQRTDQLCSPLRRMWNEWPNLPPFGCNWNAHYGDSCYLPLEQDWKSFPIHRNVNEHAGYSQIFHATDPVLGSPPWHETGWVHAGGADSFFQAKWAPQNKVRPPFECLHLGPAGQNWYGRATPLADGTVPEGAAERRQRCADIWRNRRGKVGEARFEGEKIKKEEQHG